MLDESRKIYGRALRALQFALNSPEMAMKDETLAVSCLMALYEVSRTLVPSAICFTSQQRLSPFLKMLMGKPLINTTASGATPDKTG